ncbi:MAG: outer membrane protein assembly factor BamB [Gammaproteobacteria bacterium]|nr:outer membrane protein assembly factor BamB [Gammaproteobacteria bacterium]
MIRRFLFVSVFLLLAACSSEEDNTEPAAEIVEFTATEQFTRLWDEQVGDGINQQYLKLYPLLLDDHLVIADRSGVVSSLNLNNGKTLWKLYLDSILTGGVGGDNQSHIVSTRDGEIIKLSSTGKVLWRVKNSSEVLAPALSVDNRVVIRSTDGKIIALDLATGQQVWSYKRDVPALSLRGNSKPVIQYGRIYAGLDNGRLVVLDLTDGRLVLDIAIALPSGRSELERMVDIDGAAELDNGILYMASYQGRIVALDIRRGQILWTRKLSTSSGVALSGSTLFVADDRDHIWALDKNNGATLWKQDKLQNRQLTLPVIMSDKILVADAQGFIHALSQYDGHFIARTQMDDDGVLTPPVVNGNNLYVVNREGMIAAFRLGPLNATNGE